MRFGNIDSIRATPWLICLTLGACPDGDARNTTDISTTDTATDTSVDVGTADTATSEDTSTTNDISGDVPNDTTAPADESSGDASPPTRTIGWCNIQYPPGIEAVPGAAIGPVFGQVFVAGLTDAGWDTHPDFSLLEGQLGLGLDDGALFPDAWTWLPGTNARRIDNNHEFEAATNAPGSDGTYRYAWRFRFGPTGAWTYCDRDGTDNGFQREDSGVLAVVTPRPAFCKVQFPTDPVDMNAGETTPELYGRVYAPGLTGEGHDGAANIVGEVGFGPRGSTPDDDTWSWQAGVFNVIVDNGIDGQRNNDEYRGALSPMTPGNYDWAWRFRIPPHLAWRYCDKAGNDAYNPADAAQLNAFP